MNAVCAYIFMGAHMCLFVLFFPAKILCILGKMDNRMMPSVVHYQTRAKCNFLNPKSILHTMLFSGVVHPMGLNCCYINVAFLKTFSHLVSSFFISVTSQTLWSCSRNLSHSWGLALSAGKRPSQQLYYKLLWCPLICSSSRASALLNMPLSILTVWPSISALDSVYSCCAQYGLLCVARLSISRSLTIIT